MVTACFCKACFRETCKMGDGNVDDRRLEVLTQYDLTIRNYGNLRGALVLDTDCGWKVLRPSQAGEQRLEFEDVIKQYIRNSQKLCVDTVCRTREGKLFAENSYGDRFCVRDWYRGEECDLKQEEHCYTAVETLNRFQDITKALEPEEKYGLYERLPLAEQFMKRTRELKRVRSYIREKKQKNAFEVYYLKLCDGYFEQALEALEYIKSKAASDVMHLIHGNFSYHSLLTDSPLGDGCFVLTSFEKAGFGQQVSDFYYLLRKTMEKNDWNQALGHQMIERYLRVRKNSDTECALIKAQIMFPEKFWKITNFYYNNRKSWIPEKNIRKLFSNHDREPLKAEFVNTVF